MENFLDRVWGRIWAEHFSKRQDDKGSRIVLEELIEVMLNRAEFELEAETFGETLHIVLAKLGIPRHEFYQFERELEVEEQHPDEFK